MLVQSIQKNCKAYASDLQRVHQDPKPYQLGMKGGLSLASALFLLGCSDHVDPANYVASVEHCGGQALTTTVSSRVSLYSTNTSSSDTYVLQICHLDRGCTSVATYKGRVAPIGELKPVLPRD